MTATQKAQIDAMSREELARLWRQAPIGHPLLADGTGKYFKHVFFERHGGFTPALSKRISRPGLLTGQAPTRLSAEEGNSDV